MNKGANMITSDKNVQQKFETLEKETSAENARKQKGAEMLLLIY